MMSLREKELSEGKIIPISFDYHFVRIFGKEENMDIIEYLISDYYDIPIEDVTGNIKILSRDLEMGSKNEKSKQVDLLLKLGNMNINIEISSNSSIGRRERDLVYLARIHGGELKYRQKYNDIGYSWQIRFINEACNNGKLRRTYYMISDDKDRKKYSEKFRIDNVDLVAASKMKYNESNEKLVRWCKILNASTREEIVKELGDKLMDEETRKKILREVDKNSRDEDLYEIHEMYSTHEMEEQAIIDEAVEKAVDKAVKKAIEKNTKEVTKTEKIEMTKKLLKKGIDINIISEVTNLSKEEIEKLNK